MSELLMFIAQHLSFLFADNLYRIVDSSADAGGDAMVLLESPVIRLMLTRDRTQLLMAIQPASGKKSEWFSPGLLQGLLEGERPTSEVLDAGWALRLAATLPQLEERLRDPDRAAETLRELREQGRLRAKDLFG